MKRRNTRRISQARRASWQPRIASRKKRRLLALERRKNSTRSAAVNEFLLAGAAFLRAITKRLQEPPWRATLTLDFKVRPSTPPPPSPLRPPFSSRNNYPPEKSCETGCFTGNLRGPSVVSSDPTLRASPFQSQCLITFCAVTSGRTFLKYSLTETPLKMLHCLHGLFST